MLSPNPNQSLYLTGTLNAPRFLFCLRKKLDFKRKLWYNIREEIYIKREYPRSSSSLMMREPALAQLCSSHENLTWRRKFGRPWTDGHSLIDAPSQKVHKFAHEKDLTNAKKCDIMGEGCRAHGPPGQQKRPGSICPGNWQNITNGDSVRRDWKILIKW